MKRFVFAMISFVLLIPLLAYGQSDLRQVSTPNVMIIFDTSSSMNRKPDGTVQDVGSAVGIDGSTYTFEGGGDEFYNWDVNHTGTDVPDDNRWMKRNWGGNHPGSKLYQAKVALTQVINSVWDRVNLGFSTYAQFVAPRRRGYYTRPNGAKKQYWAIIRDRSWESTTVTGDCNATSFTDKWGVKHTGVTSNSTFTGPTLGDDSGEPFITGTTNNPNSCPTLDASSKYITKRDPITSPKYTISSVSKSCETKETRFSYVSQYYCYRALKDFEKDSCGNNTPGNPFPRTISDGGLTWVTYFPGDASYSSEWACRPASQPTTGQWFQFRGQTCPATAVIWENGKNVTYTLSGNCYDWSEPYYPGEGTMPKPDAWSYFKMNPADKTWNFNSQATSQGRGYYPSVDGSGNVNNQSGTFDNHTFFVNFPDDKVKAPTEIGNERTIIKNKVLDYLALNPVQNLETGNYWTMRPIHATSLAPLYEFLQAEPNNTPLADSLKWANLYFGDYINVYKGGDKDSKPVGQGGMLCRGNFVILLTDGLEASRLLSNGTPDYSAAGVEAANLLAKNNVYTYVIGFGTDLKGNQVLNNVASFGGTGQAYFASNLSELQTALGSIFGSILSGTFGRSTPVLTRQRDRIFRGFFDITGDDEWKGHFAAWNVKPNGDLESPTPVWDAATLMNQFGRGPVYTWTASGPNPPRVLFRESESSLYPLVYEDPRVEDINGDTFLDDNDAKTIINFTLDPGYAGGIYKGKRAANWKLGDIYHSTPVVVGAPSFYFQDHDYASFYLSNKDRERMIYVGANDGMLHAFRNGDVNSADGGREMFAVIPKNLLGKLRDLGTTHNFYVDASLKAYDIYFTSDAKWKTVILAGERGGGPYYFALDVTTPGAPNILWEWTEANMGDSWAKPEIGRVRSGTETKTVAFIAGGYSAVDNMGNSFYIVDMETGATIKSFTGLGTPANKIPGGCATFDVEGNGYVNYVYFGDTSGTLWKVNVSSSDTNEWTVSTNGFFTPPVGQRRPIFYPPAVAKNDDGRILVFFGTGDELDFTSTANYTGYFWEVEDQGTTGQANWVKVLPKQKVMSVPVVADYVVYFTTWTYDVAESSCGAGSGRLWGLKMTNPGSDGGTAGLVLLDPATGLYKPAVENIAFGSGIPTAPVVTNGKIYVSSSVDAGKITEFTIRGWKKTRIRSWREVY
jgi:hypothetical protein